MLKEQSRVRQHYEYRWFWFDLAMAHTQIKVWGKTIGPTTDHRDQSMKISSIFNTHKKISLWRWTKWDKLPSSNSPSYCLAYWTSSRVSNTESWRMDGLEENQHDHELNIIVRGNPGSTSEKISGKSQTTNMSLSSRTILLFKARRHDQKSKGFNPSSKIEGYTRKMVYVAQSILESWFYNQHAKYKVIVH